jgi:hypothetical protein
MGAIMYIPPLDQIVAFIAESNKIEGILREPTQKEIDEFIRFMGVESVTIDELARFVSVYQPNARLRDRIGLDVRVGNYLPPKGGAGIVTMLQQLLFEDLNAYEMHIEYEKLHPFTDGNGRSGRALWAWKQRDLKLGFLHKFYYQTLSHAK